MNVFGIDVGGSGIKGAPVDVTTGTLVGERFRVETPQPSDVTSVVAAVAEVAVTSGFFDQSHLHRHFQRRFGLSPARYAAAGARPREAARPRGRSASGGTGRLEFRGGGHPLRRDHLQR